MIDWIIAQQLLISTTLLLLILIEKLSASSLTAKHTYLLWMLLPLVLLANNLPQNAVAIANDQVYQYLVLFGAEHQALAFSLGWELVWATGALGVFACVALAQIKMKRLTINSAVQTKLSVIVPPKLKVLASDKISSPLLYGIFKPILLIPANFADTFDARQQTLIVEHELVHFYRRDNLFNLIAILLVAVFWFNPLIWLGYKAFRRNQELACDESVLINATHKDKVLYSKALVLCAENELQHLSIHSSYGEKHTMLKRISQIQKSSKTKPALAGAVIFVCCALLSCVALASMADKQETQDKSDMAKPVTRVEPLYPILAAQQRIEGSIVLQFDIEADGSTSNIQVIDAMPAYTFDREAVKALTEWKYKPRVIGGHAEKQTGLKVQLDFRMDEENAAESKRTDKIRVVN